MGAILSAILGGLVSMVQGWAEQRRVAAESKVRLAEAEANAKIARLQLAQQAEIDWDVEAMKASAVSWKDEFWTILLAVPLILCFIPGYAGVGLEGFENLAKAPDWYVTSVGVAIAAAFGFRKLVDIIRSRK